MEQKEPTHLFKSLPKNTPPWSVGLTVLSVSFISVCTLLYTTVRPELKTYLENKDLHLRTIAKEQQLYREITDQKISAILGLIDNNDKQIIELSKLLGETQREKRDLEVRVTALEKDLSDCNTKLGTHKGR